MTKKQDCKLVGIHNGIQYLIRESDGVDFYYSTKTGKTAMSMKGIARMLECDYTGIRKQSKYLGIEKQAELLTSRGIRKVYFVVEDDIAELLEAVVNSRMKKETKKKAAEVSKKYIQAGFRLQVLLNVAPQQIAKEAIDRVDNEQELRHIKERADGKLVRKLFTSELQKRGVTSGRTYETNGFAQNTDAINKGVLGKSAREIRLERKVKKTRDSLTSVELSSLNLAENLAVAKMRKENAQGNKGTVICSKEAANAIGDVVKKLLA